MAREYGKPCVVGIDRVVAKLRDGELVEVDGTQGTVRLLSVPVQRVRHDEPSIESTEAASR